MRAMALQRKRGEHSQRTRATSLVTAMSGRTAPIISGAVTTSLVTLAGTAVIKIKREAHAEMVRAEAVAVTGAT